jgi:hypothetical protein
MPDIFKCRPGPVEENFFALPPGDPVRMPILVDVRVVPVEANAVSQADREPYDIRVVS